VPVTGEVELGATLGLVIGDFETNGAQPAPIKRRQLLPLKSMACPAWPVACCWTT
jgi:hypothetical protein